MKESLFIKVGSYGDVEKANHHLIRSLFAPTNSHIRIWVVRVLLGVIKPGDGLEFCSRFQGNRIREFVAHLPMKMVVHAQQGFETSVLFDDVVFELLAP